MRSLDDLRGAVRSRAVREQFDEVIRTYSSGAYRTATIALWITVVQDLLGKIRELADDGDKAALSLIADIDGHRSKAEVRKLLDVEGGILDRALSDFELIEPAEHEQLNRLRTDRNVCAHPSFQSDEEASPSITEEQVRAYMVVVVDSVLSQPPIVGKALVERYIDDTKGQSWPDADPAPYVRTRYFSRARVKTQRQILQLAVKASIAPPEGDNLVAGRNICTLRAASAFDEGALHDAVSEVLAKQRDTMDDHKLRRMIGAVGWLPRTWDVVGGDVIAKCSTLLKASDTSALVEDKAFASGPPAHPELARHYTDALKRVPLPSLVDMSGRTLFERRQFIPLLLAQIEGAQDWATGGYAMGGIAQLADQLTPEEMRAVARIFIENGEVHSSFSTPLALLTIVRRTRDVPGARDVWTDMVENYRTYFERTGLGPYRTSLYAELEAELGVEETTPRVFGNVDQDE